MQKDNFLSLRRYSLYVRLQTNQRITKKTTGWLSIAKDPKHGDVNKKNIDELRDCLRFHEYRYYVQNDPLVSDFEYDSLYKLLEKFEKKTPAVLQKIPLRNGLAKD